MEYTSATDMFHKRVEASSASEAYRYKKDGAWKSFTWGDYGRQVRSLALSLLDLGLAKGDKVCIIANTRWEWEIADKAINLFGAITVGIYQTLPADQVQYILSHSDAKAVVAEDKVQFEKVLRSADACPELVHVIAIEPEGCEGREVLLFSDLIARSEDRENRLGSTLDALSADVGPEDPATYIYTSGTTGPPKGAILTHRNFLGEAGALASNIEFTGDDITLTWLPFSHIFQRACTATGTYSGKPTAFAESIDKLLENLSEVRPTIFYSVPRIYEKAYAKILDNAKSGGMLKEKIFLWSMAVGRRVSQHRQSKTPLPALLKLRYEIARRLVFGKINAVLGGRIRLAFSSGAPISQEILEFFHAADILVLEAYGATELTAAVTLNLEHEYRFGTVGRPIGNMELLIAQDGEILMRGDMVFAGYYKDQELTREVLSQDGWYATGDIGVIDPDGALRITDRKKDIIVTSGGKNVAPQNIENLLKENTFISQAMVHGDKRNYLTCLVTLDPEYLVPWAEKEGLSTADWNALCAEPGVRGLIQGEVDKANATLAKFETIKKFAIVPDEFTIDGGELTPTLKVKRKVVTEKYRPLLDSMYEE